MDIRQKPWADPIVKTFVDQYYRLTRAKEEITRLNVEMRRMRTWIRDDERLTREAIGEIAQEHPTLAYEIQRRLDYKVLVNDRIWKQLDEIELYRGFSGIRGCGVGRNSEPNANPLAPRFTPSTTPSSSTAPGPAAGPSALPNSAVPDDDASSVGSVDDTERERRLEALDDFHDRTSA